MINHDPTVIGVGDGDSMHLAAPAPRERLHKRIVECEAFSREDGLWDIEGALLDTSSRETVEYGLGTAVRRPGEPIHLMNLRITIDDDYVIRAVEAVMRAHPFSICPQIVPAYQDLVGLRLGAGFKKAVHERVGGAGGCT